MGICYVYKWIHKPTMMWYVGSRTAKNSHLNDGYLCSSKIVKPLIQKNPQDWEKQIIELGDAQSMRLLETEILTSVDAKNDPRSFNKHNQDANFICTGHSEETIKKLKANHPFRGKKRPDHAKKLQGRVKTEQEKRKLSQSLKGREFTSDAKQKMKESKSIGTYYTPAGIFISARDAATANNCSKFAIMCRCIGWYSQLRKKWYPPIDGWNFVRNR